MADDLKPGDEVWVRGKYHAGQWRNSVGHHILFNNEKFGSCSLWVCDDADIARRVVTPEVEAVLDALPAWAKFWGESEVSRKVDANLLRAARAYLATLVPPTPRELLERAASQADAATAALIRQALEGMS